MGMNRVLGWVSKSLAGMALVCGAGLLASDANVRLPWGLSSAAISATPLLLIGVAFVILQATMRPRWTEVVKNLLLAATFILWGVVQLMEPSALSKVLGDVVIALYVLDLAWVVLASAAPG